MTTLLPKDADNNAIPALRLKPAGAHQINVTDSAARNILAFDIETKVVALYATDAVFLAFGDETVSATTADHYFPAGVYYDVAIMGGTSKGAHHTHVSALRADADCTLYISEKE